MLITLQKLPKLRAPEMFETAKFRGEPLKQKGLHSTLCA